MPYSTPPEKIKVVNGKQTTPKQRRAWMHAFNSAWQRKPGDEGYAHRVAYSALNKAAGMNLGKYGAYSHREAVERIQDAKSDHRNLIDLYSHSDVPIDSRALIFSKEREARLVNANTGAWSAHKKRQGATAGAILGGLAGIGLGSYRGKGKLIAGAFGTGLGALVGRSIGKGEAKKDIKKAHNVITGKSRMATLQSGLSEIGKQKRRRANLATYPEL